MLQLFDDPAIQSFAKPAKVRGALWSAAVHVAVFAILVALSLAPAFRGVPDDLRVTVLAPPPLAPPPPPPPPAAVAKAAAKAVARTEVTPVRRAPRVFQPVFTASVAIPKSVPGPTIIGDLPTEFGATAGVVGGVVGGVEGGVEGGVIGGMIGSAPVFAPPPAPVAAKKEVPPPPRVIRVSAVVQEAMLLEMIQPEYPAHAKIARLQGTVRLKAIIDGEGKVTQLEVVEGHPLLAPAARDAVAKWRYRPTYLDGKPVSVSSEVIVHFRLM